MHSFRRRMATVVFGVALAAAPTAGAADHPVSVSDFAFSPVNVPISQGDTVTWTNMGGTHNVRFDDGGFEMPAAPSATAWMVTRPFDATGTFTYYCELHGGPNGSMEGTVTVTSSGPGGPGTPGPGQPQPGGDPPAGTPGSPVPIVVTLKLSDRRPEAGQRVRFSGTVTPALDGQAVQIQRRTRTGSFKTVAKTALRDAGDERSKYSLRIRMLRDAVFRARVAPGTEHQSDTSSRKRVDVS
jgi:plastocyanin